MTTAMISRLLLRLAPRCCLPLYWPKPHAHLFPQPQHSSQQQRCLEQAATPLAASGQGPSGGGARSWPRRERVRFIVPNQKDLKLEHVTQRSLNDVLNTLGALGFEAASGWTSREVGDLPEDGTVKVVFPDEPKLATQVKDLQGTIDNDTRAKEEQVAAFLRNLASSEAPGAPLTTLPTAPFTRANGQDYVQLDAAVVTGDTVYVGEYKRVLSEEALDHLVKKVVRIREALRRGISPDLALALQGVSRAKLFLAGDAVQPGLTVNQLAEVAATDNACLVLPSGQALGLASEPAPFVQL